MNNFQRSFLISILSIALFLSQDVAAQTAILFQIPSSAGQIEAAQSAGDEKTVAIYKRSDSQIENAIMRSFKAEFGYCPVYFFNASDYEKVKNKELSEVQFYAKDGTTVMIPKDLKGYSIANISFYPKITYDVKDGMTGETIAQEEPQNFYGKGIILYDQDFVPVLGKLRFTPCKIYKRGSLFNKKKRYYDFKGAGTLNKRLKKFGWGAKSSL